MNKTLKAKAFSLIETLLVIAIIGILVSLGLVGASEYAKQVKVRKTAFDLQQILQAGSKYYLDNADWPDGPPPDNFKQYLPLGDLKNPWGYDYSYSHTDVKFQVTTTLPDKNIAIGVENLLPNAMRKNQVITMEIPVYSSKLQEIFVNHIGNATFTAGDVPTGDGYWKRSVNIPACPRGWKQYAIVTPYVVQFGTLQRNVSTFFPREIFGEMIVGERDSRNPKEVITTLRVKASLAVCEDSGDRRKEKNCWPNPYGTHEKPNFWWCTLNDGTQRLNEIPITFPVMGGCKGGSCVAKVDNTGSVSFYYISYCQRT